MEGCFIAGAPGRSECSRDFFLCRGRRSILPQHLLHDLFDHGGFYGWRWGRRGRALPAVGRHRAGQKDGSAPPRWSRRWRCRGSCPKAGGKMGKRNPRGKPLGFWRSIRDLNSGGAVNALSHFECDLFDLLSNAPYKIVRQARRVGYRRSPTTPYYTKKFPARQEKFDAPGFYSSTISQCHSLSPAWIA